MWLDIYRSGNFFLKFFDSKVKVVFKFARSGPSTTEDKEK